MSPTGPGALSGWTGPRPCWPGCCSAFLPELGSRLYQLGREKPSAREALALQYVTEALAQEKDLAVLRTALTQEGAGAAVLQVELEWRGAPLAIQVDLTM